MKKFVFTIALFALFTAACVDSGNKSAQNTTQAPVNGLQLLTEANPEWHYENLRLYPVVADDATIAANNELQSLKTLAEGMATPGFRITELKQFGRSAERTFNALTLQNKSTETIFMMSGDVVTGGNQDRVIAHDDIVMPGTIKNIDVFCVEQGRWNFTDSTASESEKAAFVFRGYYNVASPQVRQAVQRTGSQQEVWSAVAKVTTANNASSGTSTYTALETENEFKTKREACLRFFEGKLIDRPNVVGVVAVCNGVVIGVDIFGHPSLFQRQFESLIHGYATEAGTSENLLQASEKTVQGQFQSVAHLAGAGSTSNESAGKLVQAGKWIHLFSK